MKLYRTTNGFYAEDNGTFYTVDAPDWDQLIASPDVYDHVKTHLSKPVPAFDPSQLLAPVGIQEVWAAGVTYYRSRDARMEESKDAGRRHILRTASTVQTAPSSSSRQPGAAS